MALIECRDPVYDRKVDEVLKMLEDGMDRAEIAQKLGYKNQVSLDNYMRRRNFSWDSRENNFVPAAERYSAKAKNNIVPLHGTSKTDMVISLFGQGESDAKDIAKQVGLDSHTEMANYMKKKGYVWDADEKNYIKSVIPDAVTNANTGPHLGPNGSLAEVLERMLPLLRNTQPAMQQVVVTEENKTIPRYQLKGSYGTKAMRMANALDELVKCFSQERNITQREVMEVALIEFFQRYGYKDEVEKYFIE